jgi:hypothetical protein
MNERKISLGPTIAQQNHAHTRLMKRRASSERGAGPQGMVLDEVRSGTPLEPLSPYGPSKTAQTYTQGGTPLYLEPPGREPLGIDPLSNTLCPKIGAAQWTCTKDECTCHLKESIGVIKVGPIR